MSVQPKTLKVLSFLLFLGLLGETGYLLWNGSGTLSPEVVSKAEGRKILYYQAPMDPTYISDEPGKSPMGMDLIPVYEDEAPGLHGAAAGQETGVTEIYTCSMHPEVIQDHPGRCPQCGMELVKKTIDTAETETVYTCPMHQEVISHEPGKCPICGMDLVSKKVPKTGVVRLTTDVIQKIGVRTALVDEFPLQRTIRTVGRIIYDETRMFDITTKIGGWVDKLYVNFTGQMVQKGDPLIDIYSPELVSTQEEYLLALTSEEKFADSRFPEVSSGARSLLNSTRRRLLLWDITDEQIVTLEREKTVQKLMTIYSPQRGIIINKTVFDGGYVKPEMPLYRIVDLSTVWVDVSIYEYELPWVRVGQEATMTLSYEPGKEYNGTITFIYPFLEKQTRTVKVRMEFPNPKLELKPEMYANIIIKSPVIVEGLAVPDEAVIRSGERNVVIVDLGNGVFEPRGVTLGVEADNHYQVSAGLKAGDRIVTSAQFLIDSESRLKEAIQKMLARRKTGEQEK